MTIKEIETASGIPRANIRFYETQGLISPVRGENSYRDYSLRDLKMLLRIKLLRSLDVSIDEIKQLISGERQLDSVLRTQLESLQQRQAALSRSETLCRMMLTDGAQFTDLDAQHYLEADLCQQDMQKVISLDRIPPVPHPFRRWFARSIDYGVYGLFIRAFLCLCGVNVLKFTAGQELLVSLVQLALIFIFEPLLLHHFGTTPGKWIFGMYLTGPTGGKPSTYACFYRLWDILRYTYGFFIPFYSIYCLWKSMTACLEEEDLPWESDTTLVIKDTAGWRIGAWAGAEVALAGLMVLLGFLAVMPGNRGELTPAEFAENYNQLTKDYTNSILRMDEKGHWYNAEYSNGFSVVISTGHSAGEPKVEFTTDEEGYITAVSFTKTISDPETWAPNYATTIILAAKSLVQAQPGAGLWPVKMDKMLEFIEQEPYRDFEYSFYGVHLVCDYEYSGYGSSSFGLHPVEDDCYYSMSFTMTLE